MSEFKCEGKVIFPDMGIAKKIAEARKRRSKGRKPGLAYRCPECKAIHIGRPWNKQKLRWN